MDVLDHDEQRPARGEVVQQRGEGLEEAAGAGTRGRCGTAVGVQGGHEPSELDPGGTGPPAHGVHPLAVHEVGEQVDERCQRQRLGALGHAVADENLDVALLTQRVRELADDPGLADPGGPLDQRHDRTPLVERARRQPLQVLQV